MVDFGDEDRHDWTFDVYYGNRFVKSFNSLTAAKDWIEFTGLKLDTKNSRF